VIAGSISHIEKHERQQAIERFLAGTGDRAQAATSEMVSCLGFFDADVPLRRGELKSAFLQLNNEMQRRNGRFRSTTMTGPAPEYALLSCDLTRTPLEPRTDP